MKVLKFLGVLSVAAPTLVAQTIPPESERRVVDLPPLDIMAVRESGYVATHGMIGTRTATPLIETPQSITVIMADQIRDQNAQTMQEVLRYAAGVRAEMYGLDNRGDWFTLRGGSEGSTVLDGLRLPLTGWYGVVRNEPYAFERVEILRGPSSVMVGQNGPGGVVNLVTKRPQEVARGEINFQVGTNNHRKVAGDLTGPLNDERTVLFRVVGLARKSDTQIRFADEERQYLAPSLTWRPSPATAMTFIAHYQRDRSRNTEGFFPWAGTLYPGPNGYIPSDTFVSEPGWDIYGGDRVRLGYQFEHRLSAQWSIRHHARYDRVSGELRSMYANFWEVDAEGNGYGDNATGANRTIGRTWYATDDEGRIFNGDLLAEGQFDAGAVQHTLLIGADGLSARNSQQYLNGAATPIDVYTPEYGTFSEPDLAFGSPSTTRTREYGLIVQDQLKVGEFWVAVAGVRYSRIRTSVDGSTAAGHDDSAWTKSLGLVFKAANGWAPYASYAESFEAVSGTNAGNVPFKPKRGEQIEFGLRWSPPGQRVVTSAAAYELREDGRLTPDPKDPSFSVQRGEVTVRGIELEASANVEAWNFVANYTYADAKQTASSIPDDPYLDKRLTSIPEHSAAVWAVHTFAGETLRGLRAGLGARYVGTTWDGTDSLATPSNTLADALVSYDRGPWSYALNVTNLFDKSYVATALERGDSWYGARREVIGTVSHRW